jgi:sigma-E factor negative regulatory protein RseC
VIETDGDHARISTSRRGICEGCTDKSSCGFDMALGKEIPEEVRALNPIRARAGDRVEFDLPGHTELKVSLMVWVVPLAGLIAGAAAGSSLNEMLSMDQDLATLLGAALGFLVSFAPVVLYDRKAGRNPRLVPRIIKVVNSSSCPDGSGQGPSQEP